MWTRQGWQIEGIFIQWQCDMVTACIFPPVSYHHILHSGSQSVVSSTFAILRFLRWSLREDEVSPIIPIAEEQHWFPSVLQGVSPWPVAVFVGAAELLRSSETKNSKQLLEFRCCSFKVQYAYNQEFKSTLFVIPGQGWYFFTVIHFWDCLSLLLIVLWPTAGSLCFTNIIHQHVGKHTDNKKGDTWMKRESKMWEWFSSAE